MRLSRFNFEYISNVEALSRAIKNAQHLKSEHAALVKAAFDMAEALDTLHLGRDETTSRFTIGRLQNTYVELLKSLGLNYEKVSAMSKVDSTSDGGREAGSPVLSLVELRKAAGGE